MSKVPPNHCYAGETFAKGVSFSVLTLEMAFYPPPMHEHRCVELVLFPVLLLKVTMFAD